MASNCEKNLYQIKIEGELDRTWEEYFGQLTITHDPQGNSILTGPIVDHTALHSILLKIRDMNLKLISVNQIEMDRNDMP